MASSRVLFGPHETNLGRGRCVADRHAAYYARRAAGGAGVIVTEIASVHPSDWPYERAPLVADSGAGWREVVDACRPHGTLVLAGLGHAGAQGSSAYAQRELWGASRIADATTREVPMVLEQPEIDALVAAFGTATELAVDAGLDGVEINAGQHSLLRQFLSGLTNTRADAYGADRSLLLRAVVDAVRAGLGSSGVLGLRLCCDELAPWAGITPGSWPDVDVDYVVPVRGSGLSVAATRPDWHTAPGFNRDLCTLVGSRTDAAVVLQGSVVDPAMAQAAVEDGTADLVEMTRALIAEPDLVAHVRAGEPGRIRPCTLANRRTAVRDPRNALVSDDAEPRSGHETLDPPIDGTDACSRDVLVVGGGPAGMEAARVLGLRGHRVRLVERDRRLGGALWAAAVINPRMALLVAWWERELGRAGVKVETGVPAGLVDLDAAGAVLLATGARPGARDYPSDGPVVGVGDEVPAGPVVVHDPVGDATGVGIAEQLAGAGRDVVLVTPDQVAGKQLVDPAGANARLARAGVVRELRSRLCGVRAGAAELEHVWTGQRRLVPCGVVVDCGFRLPADDLWVARPHLHRAGDCRAPRTVHDAVLEARRAAMAIGATP